MVKKLTKKQQREEREARRMEQDGAMVRAILEKPPVEKPPVKTPPTRTGTYVEPITENARYWAELLR